jgi:hypothetical protein
MDALVPDWNRSLEEEAGQLKVLGSVVGTVRVTMADCSSVGLFRFSCVAFNSLSALQTNAPITSLLVHSKGLALPDVADYGAS